MNYKLYKLPLLKLTPPEMFFTKSAGGGSISKGPTNIKMVPIP
jgi:hypothetical protein